MTIENQRVLGGKGITVSCETCLNTMPPPARGILAIHNEVNRVTRELARKEADIHERLRGTSHHIIIYEHDPWPIEGQSDKACFEK